MHQAQSGMSTCGGYTTSVASSGICTASNICPRTISGRIFPDFHSTRSYSTHRLMRFDNLFYVGGCVYVSAQLVTALPVLSELSISFHPFANAVGAVGLRREVPGVFPHEPAVSDRERRGGSRQPARLLLSQHRRQNFKSSTPASNDLRHVSQDLRVRIW